jgi:SAM-dependent methyltransferase
MSVICKYLKLLIANIGMLFACIINNIIRKEHFKMNAKEKIHDEMLSVFLNMYSSQVNYLRPGRKEERKMEKKGSWHFIPNRTYDVFETFIVLKDYLRKEERWSAHSNIHRSKFLDAGCGIGNILLIARYVRLCENIYGLELSDSMIEKAKEFIAPHERTTPYIHINKANVMEYDNYGDYDIIYYFCPLKDYKMEMKFERKVEDEMKVGAVLASSKQDHNIKRDKRFEKIKLFKYENIQVYIKIKQ